MDLGRRCRIHYLSRFIATGNLACVVVVSGLRPRPSTLTHQPLQIVGGRANARVLARRVMTRVSGHTFPVPHVSRKREPPWPGRISCLRRASPRAQGVQLRGKSSGAGGRGRRPSAAVGRRGKKNGGACGTAEV